MADRDELQRIAAAMNALRPDWPTRSLVTFLERHHAGRAYRDLAIAAVTVATDTKTQTPNLLNEHGAWWSAAQTATGTGGTSVPSARQPRCTVPGHEHELAVNCVICKTDGLDIPEPPPLTALSPDQAARNAHHAAIIRAALTPTGDPR